MPAWEPKITKFDEVLAEEEQRVTFLKERALWQPVVAPVLPMQQEEAPKLPAWEPVQLPELQSEMPQIPRPDYERMDQFLNKDTASNEMQEPVAYSRPGPRQAIQPKEMPKESPQTETPDTPLWAKTLNFIGKPFELVQDYLFNPVLAAAHLPFTRQLSTDETKTAEQQGVRSYFPGGVRYQAYKDLEYFGKWAVEMLPWLIVPPIGAVGKVGAAGKGIAGALGKMGTAGVVAGKALEYSPAGLAEKAVGAVVGGVVGKLGKKAISPVPPQTADPILAKAISAIKASQAKLPEQKILTHELRVQQLQKAEEGLSQGAGEQSLYNFMKALQGKGDKVAWEGIGGKLSSTEINQLSEILARSPKVQGFDRAPAISGWRKILHGPELPFDSELEQLQKVFGPELIESIISKRPGQTFNKVMDIANAPRAVLSSVDLSALLRQGAILTARHPVESMKTVAPMVKSFFSDNNAKIVDDIVRSRSNTALGEQSGLYLAPLPGKYTPLSNMEESFMSKWIESIPVLGQVIKASNRAYVTGLNDLRSRVWENTLTSWGKLKQPITDVDYKGLATLINAASGRGSLPRALQGASPLLNATLFSPRLFMSRLQFPAMMFSESPLVRKEAARQLVQFMGTGTAILGMAKVAGAKVETDPRSSDFGKIRVGSTRLDIWSGYAQWARFMAQLTTEQRKSQYGNISEVNRRDLVDRFMQSKYSPAMGLINDILRGESYSGEDVSTSPESVQRQAFQRLAPLFIQDMIDAIDQEGMIGGVIASPGLFGVGITTYMSPAQKLRDELAQQKYGVNYDKVGLDPKLGRVAQLDLERSSPKLLALVQQENEDYNKTISGKSDLNNIYRNQTTTIENEFKSKIILATNEFRDTQDGYKFREKTNNAAMNRRSQYDILNKDPQFANIVARYDELPNANDLQKMSPQDWARKWYMNMMYSKDMYDQYGNYRFDMIDDMRERFAQSFGASMLDYVETYQGMKEADMPAEYIALKKAEKAMRPYWQVVDKVTELFGETFAQSQSGQRFISSQRRQLRLTNPDIAQAYSMFYARPS